MSIDLNNAPTHRKALYRETIRRSVIKDHIYKLARVSFSEFARLKIVVSATQPELAVAFENKVSRGAIPDYLVPGVEQGIQSVIATGVLGYPLVGVRVSLMDGAYHDVDSSILTFETAARTAFCDALREAGPVIVEPFAVVTFVIPQKGSKAVIKALKTCGGRIEAEMARAYGIAFTALAPLAEMPAFEVFLRETVGGRTNFSVRFNHYEHLDVEEAPDVPLRPFPTIAALRAG